MSVIAWDGKTLAADRRASLGTLIRTTRKIFMRQYGLVGYAGDADQGEEMLRWLEAGAVAADFPPSQRDRDNWAGVLVINPDRQILKYERTPYPLTFHDGFFAIGSGRDFALAAMHLGKTAREAVEVACHFDSGCGNGVDEIEFPWGST